MIRCRDIKTEVTDSSVPTDFTLSIDEETTIETIIEKSNEREGEGYSGSEDSDSNQNEPQGVKIPIERRSYYESPEKYRKTLRLSSEQIVSI